MKFTKNTKMKEIYDAPELSHVKELLISGGNFFSGENGELTLDGLQEKNPTWYAKDIIYGIDFLKQISRNGDQIVYPVYSEVDIDNNSRLASVQLMYLPSNHKKYNTYVILLSGGAYGAVCTMVESLPVAAKLNELGISCFCLNYRTAVQDSFLKGLLPEPLEDLAAAWQYIHQNQEVFGIDAKDYIVGGFSAGGHLASLWGTEHLGARKYGIPQPKMLMLTYPLITMENVPDGPGKNIMCTGMFGADYKMEDIRHYDASRYIDKEYPKVYLVRSMDDPTVSFKDGAVLVSALRSADVLYHLEQSQSGGHGFGLGTATPLNGWVERAIEFFNK